MGCIQNCCRKNKKETKRISTLNVERRDTKFFAGNIEHLKIEIQNNNTSKSKEIPLINNFFKATLNDKNSKNSSSSKKSEKKSVSSKSYSSGKNKDKSEQKIENMVDENLYKQDNDNNNNSNSNEVSSKMSKSQHSKKTNKSEHNEENNQHSAFSEISKEFSNKNNNNSESVISKSESIHSKENQNINGNNKNNSKENINIKENKKDDVINNDNGNIKENDIITEKEKNNVIDNNDNNNKKEDEIDEENNKMLKSQEKEEKKEKEEKINNQPEKEKNKEKEKEKEKEDNKENQGKKKNNNNNTVGFKMDFVRSQSKKNDKHPQFKNTTIDILNDSVAKMKIKRLISKKVQDNPEMVFVDYKTFIKGKPYSELNKEYKQGISIGEGGFGKVTTIIHKKTGQLRAMKLIKKSQEFGFDEVENLMLLNHPNIMKLYEYFYEKR